MELIIDPASSIAFEMEREEDDLMHRPPRDPGRRLFTGRLVLRSILQGAGACLVAACVLAAGVRTGMTELDIRTLTFSTLILANLALITSNRSLTRPAWAMFGVRNPAVSSITAAAIVVLAALVYTPLLREVFRVAPLHVDDAAIVALAAVAAFAWMESVKYLCRPRPS
jgi:Ca2+-transporting ATPase